MTTRSSMRGLAAIAATGATALVLSGVTPAGAAPGHATATRHFHVRGIVVSHHGSTVRVLARTATVGAKTQHNKVVTLRLAKGSKLTQSGRAVSPSTVAQGAAIDAFGVPAGTTLVVGSANVAPQPAEALLGMVQAVNGSIAQVSVTHDKGRGDDEMADHLVTVDLSNATVHGDAVTTGQAIVALGEDEANRVFAAAQVYTFSVVPTVVPGKVAAVDDTAHTITLTSRSHPEPADGGSESATAHESGPDGGSNSGPGGSGSPSDGPGDAPGDQPAPAPVTTNVDTANAALYLDGASATTIPVGARALVIGTADSSSGVLHAVLVIAFDNNDDHPCPQGSGHDD